MSSCCSMSSQAECHEAALQISYTSSCAAAELPKHGEALIHPSFHLQETDSTSALQSDSIAVGRRGTDLTKIRINDPELMRGISLRKTLQLGDKLWLEDPSAVSKARLSKIFSASQQTNRYDIFLSHTWHTHGAWKFLCLLLHFGWPIVFLFWAFGVVLAYMLVLLDILPLTTTWEAVAVDFQSTVPYGCWVMVIASTAAVLGLLASPYFPLKSDMCFLDFVCVNQTDDKKMKEGIRAIGAFLAASSELRVLWSAPYLDRLWCLFELAAYRKLNPQGRIVARRQVIHNSSARGGIPPQHCQA